MPVMPIEPAGHPADVTVDGVDPVDAVVAAVDAVVDVRDLQLPGLDELPGFRSGRVPVPALAALLASLDAAALLTDHEVLDLVAAYERLTSWAHGGGAAALAEFARRPEHVGPDPRVPLAAQGRVGDVVREFVTTEVA